ncbi:hypothetical protein HY733_02540 [Candidatus Uhrbacteria bacterium]|nr:hypothetical protein [Candidatus Uhrbacteria bacterium]
MKFFPLLLVPFILLGAGCAASTTTSLPADVTAVETLTPETTSTISYVMSNDFLMFSAPSDWSIAQYDGGSASTIEIESPLGESVTIAVEIAETFEGESIDYQDWLEENFDFSNTSSTINVGGYTFDFHEIVTEGQESQQVLTSEIQGVDRRYFVDILLSLDAQREQQAVLDSVEFNPSIEARSTAQVIR